MLDLGCTWRVSRTIFARGRLERIRDMVNYSLVKDYLVSWNLTPKLVLGGQVYLDSGGRGRRSGRYSASATYKLGMRNTAFIRWNEADLDRAGGNDSETLHAGIRIGL